MSQDRYPIAEDCRNGHASRQSQSETVRLFTAPHICRGLRTHSTKCFQAAPPSHNLGCIPPWRADNLKMGTQEQRYEAPNGDHIPSGYDDPRRDTQHNLNVTFPPATESLIPAQE
jgi:hypothetical protein